MLPIVLSADNWLTPGGCSLPSLAKTPHPAPFRRPRLRRASPGQSFAPPGAFGEKPDDDHVLGQHPRTKKGTDAFGVCPLTTTVEGSLELEPESKLHPAVPRLAVVSTLLGLQVKKSGDVNVVFGAPQLT